jgi:hypothetical protein
MTWLLRAIRPVVRNAVLLYHERALREIDPLHPDVPEIVIAINRLKAERSAS